MDGLEAEVEAEAQPLPADDLAAERRRRAREDLIRRGLLRPDEEVALRLTPDGWRPEIRKKRRGPPQ